MNLLWSVLFLLYYHPARHTQLKTANLHRGSNRVPDYTDSEDKNHWEISKGTQGTDTIRPKEKRKSTQASHTSTHAFTLKFRRNLKKKILEPLLSFHKLDIESNQEISSAVTHSSTPEFLNPSLTHQCDIKGRISWSNESILLNMLPLL